MQIVRDRIAGLSAEDQDAILGGNCARIYRRV
jgi:predicted TIM-barrel fold metal-dependent hydrolase